MNLSIAFTLAGLNLLFGSATASFFIYVSQDTTSGTGAELYYFFANYPSCNDMNGAHACVGIDDASSSQGVVCDGLGCSNGQPGDIGRLEFNTDLGTLVCTLPSPY